jgi:hypothetical protein
LVAKKRGDGGKVHVISILKKKNPLPMPFLTTEKFQLPSNGGGVLAGDQCFLVAIEHAPKV